MMTVSERYIFLTKNWKKYRTLKQDRQQPAGEVLTRALNFVFAEIGRLPYGKDEWSKCRSRIETALSIQVDLKIEFGIAALQDFFVSVVTSVSPCMEL